MHLCIASVCDVVMCVVRGSTCHCQCWVEVEGMVEAPHHRHQPPHIRDWSLPITRLQSPQSPQCPRSAQLTATLSFIISAHSLHDLALSTASAPSPAAIVELSLESLDTPIHQPYHTYSILVIQAAAGSAGRVICQQLTGSYFREAFKLFEFDIQELEESLLLHGTEDDCDQLVAQLLVSLLQGCLPSFKKRINREVYIDFHFGMLYPMLYMVRQN